MGVHSANRQSPAVLERLLRAEGAPAVERAWADFLAEYSRLILHVARSFGGSYDAAMDRYSFCVDRLRSDDCRRLREYDSEGRGTFTTWFVVVLRRFCLDQARTRYGRQRGGPPERHQQRRQLADLVAADVDTNLLPDGGSSPEAEARSRELRERLNEALERIDPEDRLLLRLRFHDEASVAEIARIFSYPSVFHVYRRLNAVYAELRQSLSEMGVRDSTP